MKTQAYINAIASISPLQEMELDTFVKLCPQNDTVRLSAIEPQYKNYISSIKLRRMSRVLKMAHAAAFYCLQKAEVEIPQMINLATGLGCQVDTFLFLKELIEQKEEILKPTAFINSTHNIPAGTLAIELKSRGQNFTFSHSQLNFEHALLDALLNFELGEASQALVGGVDEISDEMHIIYNHLGVLAPTVWHQAFVEAQSKGFIHGEGSCFAMLDATFSANSLVQIKGMHLAYNHKTTSQIVQTIHDFLNELDLHASSIDVVVCGNVGAGIADQLLNESLKELELSSKQLIFKHLTGEYNSSGAAAFNISAQILIQNQIPDYFWAHPSNETKNLKPKRSLIINHNVSTDYSLILMEKL
jgi:3-oxoacyl-(acyl-carrier-protein) synthase